MKDCIAAALILLSLLFGVPFLGTEPPEKEKEEENDHLKKEWKLESEAIIQLFLGDSELIPLLECSHFSN